MFRGGRPKHAFKGRGRGGRGAPSNETIRLKGLFADGIWHCNCTPRLPAEHFRVKKEGKNQGRWFYTCQQSEPQRCGFFLWDESAKQREEAAVLSGSRSEPGVTVAIDVEEKGNAGRGGVNGRPAAPAQVRREHSRTASPSPPPPYSIQEPDRSSLKRKAQATGCDDKDEDFFPWPLTGQEEAEMAEVADAAAPQTPHKVQRTGVYATPATSAKRKLPWLERPDINKDTGKSESYFGTPSKSPPTNCPAPVTPAPPSALLVRVKSPSPPSRYKDALMNPADSGSSLTSEVLAALHSTSLPSATLSALRTVVSKHDLRTQGVIRGRDISRLAIKAKDAKIAELQARIASLEAEREVDRGAIRQMRWENERVWLT